MLWDLRGAFRFSSAVFSMFALFLLSWEIMGYSHSTDAAHSFLRIHPGWQWWMVASTLIVGLGFRIIGFRWVSFDRTDRLSALFLATVAGFLLFSVLLQLPDGNEHYGFYFLQCMFSIFAFSQWKDGWWHSERRQCVNEWVRLARNVAVVCAGSGLLLGGYSYLRYHHTGVDHFIVKLFATAILAVFFAGLFIILKKRRWYANLASGAVISLLLLGFTGWIPAWLDFGLGWLRLNVTVSAGEVQGLERLQSLSRPGQRFATNKHDLGGMLVPKAFSYSYASLAQRPVLLEGYLARGETSLPWFPKLLHDNDLMFTTTDPNQLRSIARKWDVHWLVARPGSDISLLRPLPKWLIEEHNTGTLKVYDVNDQ